MDLDASGPRRTLPRRSPLPAATRWLRGHPRAADLGLGLVAAAMAIATTFTSTPDPGQRDGDALAVVLCLVAGATVGLRRVRPLIGLWAGVVPVFTFWILDYVDGPIGFVLLAAVYSVAVHAPRNRRTLLVMLAFAVANTSVLVAGLISAEEDLSVIDVISGLVVFVVAWTLGDSIRNRRAYLAEVERRAAEAEAHHAEEARRMLAEERSAIARDLHDIVAHSLSVMVVQAAAARRVAPAAPERAAAAIEAVESTGRQALDEMRRLLGVLRADDEAALAPQPGIDQLADLAHQCAEAGLPVALDIDVGGAVDVLPGGVQLTVYRVVQESLTNTLKHAGGRAEARVGVTARGDAVEVVVVDDGAATGSDTNGLGTGQGLVGMRERVEAFGGRLDAGRRDGRGYEVRATIPLEPRP